MMILLTCVLWCGEFKTYENGYIYADQTMWQLREIADRRQKNFQVCQTEASCTALSQGAADVYVFTGNTKTLDKVIQIIRADSSRTSLSDQRQVNEFFSNVPIARWGNNYQFIGESELPYNFHPDEQNGSWLWERIGSRLVIVRLTETLQAPQIPERYTHLIRYVDCMIDPTGTLAPDAEPMNYDEPPSPQYDALISYLDAAVKAGDEKETFLTRTEKLAGHSEFIVLLKAAAEETISQHRLRSQLEQAVESHLGPKWALSMKRSYIVTGGCSQDRAPRYHAQSIARLSAESNEWDVFMQAHLSLLNDWFPRNSDASYAQARRGTYLAELDALNIDVLPLTLGMTFVVESDDHHYFGNTERLGRAFANHPDRFAFEDQVLAIIDDDELDAMNRVRFANLYLNYAAQGTNGLGMALDLEVMSQSWPGYLQKYVASWRTALERN
ncbi:MAG: hypothetical protein KDC35_07735 [Acidobacteria bacterium]|nr:hypothetical protein [Acidobacteriota bacterium]